MWSYKQGVLIRKGSNNMDMQCTFIRLLQDNVVPKIHPRQIKNMFSGSGIYITLLISLWSINLPWPCQILFSLQFSRELSFCVWINSFAYRIMLYAYTWSIQYDGLKIGHTYVTIGAYSVRNSDYKKMQAKISIRKYVSPWVQAQQQELNYRQGRL